MLGSIFTSLYADRIGGRRVRRAAGAGDRRAAQDSVAAAIGAAEQATGSARIALTDGLQASFMSGFHAASLVAAAACLLGAAFAVALPGRPQREAAPTTVSYLEPAGV